MAEYTFLEVGYGSFGLPLYDDSEHSWTFGRNPGVYHALKFLEPFELLHAGCPQVRHSSTHVPDRLISTKKYLRQVVDSRHDIYGSLHLVSPSLFASQIVSKAQMNHDPCEGEILAAGLFCRTEKIRTPIFGLPGGASGESLRLVTTELFPYRFRKRQGFLLVPRPKDTAWSAGRGAAIRQICFSSSDYGSEGGSKYLAVRYPSSISIFQIDHLATVVPPTGYVHGSRFSFAPTEVRRFVEIPLHSGFSYSDVTFNPWYHRQIAVVDQSGSWSIIDIKEERLVLPTRVLTPSYSGTIKVGIDKQSKAKLESQHRIPEYVEDGWARFRWICDVNTLVLCTRTHVEFVDLKGRSLSARDLATQETNTWNVDIRICSKNRDLFFILTTTKILWCRVLPSDDPDAGGRILLSVRHFRDPGDLTMQIKLLEEEDEILVILHSRRSPIMSCYRFGFSDDYNAMPVMLSDPSDLILPSPTELPVQETNLSIRDLQIRRLKYRNRDRRTPGVELNSDLDATRFYEVEILLNEYSLLRSLVYSENQSPRSGFPLGKLYSTRAVEEQKSLANSFIVPDGMLEGTLGDNVKLPISTPAIGIDPFAMARMQALHAPPIRVANNMRLLYKELLCDPVARREKEPMALDKIVEIVKGFIKDSPEHLDHVLTLLELFQMSALNSSTVNYEFKEFENPQHILTSIKAWEKHGVVIDQIPIHLFGLVKEEMIRKHATNNMYTIVTSALLNRSLPKITAQFVEKRQMISRQIATQLCLASARVFLHRTGDSQAFGGSKGTSSSAFTSALFSTQAPSQNRDTSPTWITPGTSSNPTALGLIFDLGNETSRYNLARYVRLSTPLPEPRKSTVRNLQHWNVGEDPQLYDYTATTRRIERAIEMSQMTAVERRRAAATEKKRESRRAKESDRYSQLSHPADSQASISLSQPSTGALSLSVRPKQSLLKTALERGQASSQIPSGSQMSSGSQSQRQKKKRTKGF